MGDDIGRRSGYGWVWTGVEMTEYIDMKTGSKEGVGSESQLESRVRRGISRRDCTTPFTGVFLRMYNVVLYRQRLFSV